MIRIPYYVKYTQVKEYRIAEVSGTRPVRGFLLAFRSTNSSLADTHLVLLKHLDEIDPYEIVENSEIQTTPTIAATLRIRQGRNTLSAFHQIKFQ